MEKKNGQKISDFQHNLTATNVRDAFDYGYKSRPWVFTIKHEHTLSYEGTHGIVGASDTVPWVQTYPIWHHHTQLSHKIEFHCYWKKYFKIPLFLHLKILSLKKDCIVPSHAQRPCNFRPEYENTIVEEHTHGILETLDTVPWVWSYFGDSKQCRG